eukprot:CAMPEP_0194268074 /NCGR_PEP_ID=MMETSP0169-20130528/2457_1 /TAXON_ID=218684 /ORGANISM="Corethron pennatum, Strain L29A3" /LENGTH=151 /DNA_ID=CAMNT_0039009161 /DNA_START=84 /DNA_END=539 /DNA_ORIENTATION=-
MAIASSFRRSFVHCVGLVVLLTSFSRGAMATEPVRPNLMGGFSPVPPTSADVQTAAEYAVLTQYAAVPAEVAHLGSPAPQLSRFGFVVTSASRQVVAGFNFKMTVELRLDGACVEVHDVTVYRALSGRLSVTRRSTGACPSLPDAATETDV